MLERLARFQVPPTGHRKRCRVPCSTALPPNKGHSPRRRMCNPCSRSCLPLTCPRLWANVRVRGTSPWLSQGPDVTVCRVSQEPAVLRSCVTTLLLLSLTAPHSWPVLRGEGQSHFREVPPPARLPCPDPASVLWRGKFPLGDILPSSFLLGDETQG